MGEPSQAEIVEEYIEWKIHGGPVEELSAELREILEENKVQAYLDQKGGL